MRSRDYGSGMRDTEIVAAIVAGDPEGLAAAYDKYAAQLYTYCRALLREPADAADAVQDTFVIAASRLGGLRDRERLRPWLYAVARNECRRRMRERSATSTLDEAQDMTDQTAEVGTDAERDELRALLRAAVLGLNPAEHEVIELQLRQGLDGTEVADVLGISRNHAHALMSRARDQLEVCLGVLLVARTGRTACDALNTLLQDWDGQLTTLLRKRLNRHVERCPVCAERRRNELRPALLLGIAPLAALPAIAAPPGLREQVLRLASSNGPEAIAHRASVAARRLQFGQHGFPKPLDPPRSHWWQARSAQVTAGVAGVAAAIIVIAVLISGGGGSHRPEAAGSGAAPGASSRAQTAPATTPGSAPGSSGTAPGRVSPGAPAQSPGSALASASSTSGTGPGPTSPGASSPGKPPTSPAPSHSSPRPSSSSPSSPTTPPPTSAAPGTLSVSPTTVVLSLLGGTDVTITAAGGPVNWSVSEPSSLIGSLNVSPSSGTLRAGQSATIVITVSGLASVDTTLSVNPGGHAITVVLGVL
jgi:RNA polymerase sigma factor (sigma-70 family)